MRIGLDAWQPSPRMPASADIASAIARGAMLLRSSGSPTPRLDAELLLEHVTGRQRTWLLAHPEAGLDEVTLRTLDDYLARRSRGEPIAYIRGFKDWLSLRIRTDARGLVPRPETEVLAEAAIAEIVERLVRERGTIVAWDLATGSGAVAVALALRFRSALKLHRLTLVASDRSPDALELASENLAAHGVSQLVSLACADLLAPAGESLPRPSVVVANLPYMPSADVDAAGGSLPHEPRVALDGGRDGMELLRRLFDELPQRAAAGATVLLEVGVDQAAGVCSLAPADAAVSTIPDLSGVDRVVVVRLAS